jgi:hypothetical protein
MWKTSPYVEMVVELRALGGGGKEQRESQYHCCLKRDLGRPMAPAEPIWKLRESPPSDW